MSSITLELELEVEVEIEYSYDPGDLGVHTYPNGDPGYPGISPFVEIHQVKLQQTVPCTAKIHSKAGCKLCKGTGRITESIDITRFISHTQLERWEEYLLLEQEGEGGPP